MRELRGDFMPDVKRLLDVLITDQGTTAALSAARR